MTHLPLLGPLLVLVYLSIASFENVLENRCLPLNTDFLGHPLSHSHVLFPPRLVLPASFENVLDFCCLLSAHACPTSDARYFLMFPHLSPFHYSAILRMFSVFTGFTVQFWVHHLSYTSLLTYSLLCFTCCTFQQIS